MSIVFLVLTKYAASVGFGERECAYDDGCGVDGFDGEIDEAYFGPTRVRGKRGSLS